jgi:predicted nucleotidyltransferase
MNTTGRPQLANAPRQVLAEHGGVRQAILFGSRATGRASTHNDFDLADQTSGPLNAADFLLYRNHVLAKRRHSWVGK